MAQLKQLADKALEQAEEMKRLALEKQWNELEALQVQHAQLVHQIASFPLPESGQTEIRQILITVKSINNQTSEIADDYQKSLVAEQKTLKKAANMQKALKNL